MPQNGNRAEVPPIELDWNKLERQPPEKVRSCADELGISTGELLKHMEKDVLAGFARVNARLSFRPGMWIASLAIATAVVAGLYRMQVGQGQAAEQTRSVLTGPQLLTCNARLPATPAVKRLPLQVAVMLSPKDVSKGDSVYENDVLLISMKDSGETARVVLALKEESAKTIGKRLASSDVYLLLAK